MCECTTMVTSGLQPSQRGYCFSPTLRFRSSPFEGVTSPFASLFPPLKGGLGGMFLCVRSFVIQSEAMNLLLFPARFLTVFGMTRGGVRNDKGGSKSIFIQAYSPQKKQNRGINTPPLRNGAEIKRAFSPWLEYG